MTKFGAKTVKPWCIMDRYDPRSTGSEGGNSAWKMIADQSRLVFKDDLKIELSDKFNFCSWKVSTVLLVIRILFQYNISCPKAK